jgi:hypothetical protein
MYSFLSRFQEKMYLDSFPIQIKKREGGNPPPPPSPFLRNGENNVLNKTTSRSMRDVEKGRSKPRPKAPQPPRGGS